MQVKNTKNEKAQKNAQELVVTLNEQLKQTKNELAYVNKKHQDLQILNAESRERVTLYFEMSLKFASDPQNRVDDEEQLIMLDILDRII